MGVLALTAMGLTVGVALAGFSLKSNVAEATTGSLELTTSNFKFKGYYSSRLANSSDTATGKAAIQAMLASPSSYSSTVNGHTFLAIGLESQTVGTYILNTDTTMIGITSGSGTEYASVGLIIGINHPSQIVIKSENMTACTGYTAYYFSKDLATISDWTTPSHWDTTSVSGSTIVTFTPPTGDFAWFMVTLSASKGVFDARFNSITPTWEQNC